MQFNFGTPSFGTPTTSAPAFGFGTSTAKSTGTTGFGGFSFATPAQSSAPSFGLGSTTTTTNTGFSLGSLSTSTAFGGSGGSLFGTTPAVTSSSFSFPTFGQPATTTSAPSLFSGFGTQQSSAFGGLNKGLGTTTTQSTSFGGFGFGTQFGQGGFGQQQQQQQQQQQAGPQQGIVPGLDPVYNSVFNVCMFGDERDPVLARWNLLQACWGTGKGFFAANVPPVDYTPHNPLCRFKSIMYNVKPAAENKEGIVAIHFNKKEEDIRSQENQLLTSLNSVLGSKPHLVPAVDSIRAVNPSSTVVYIYLEEKAPNGMSRRVPNTEVVGFLMGAGPKQQLQNMGVLDLFPHSSLDRDALKHYLDNPPPGIDNGLWKEAQSMNPDPERFIPVVVAGFEELRWRVQGQATESKKHQVLTDRLAEEISSVERENQAIRTRVTNAKMSLIQLQHRLLKVLVRQEITRNVGVALKPEEEILRNNLEATYAQLNSPDIKGRLNEIMAQSKMQRQEFFQQNTDNYNTAPEVVEQLKQFLELEMSGVRALMSTLQTDIDDMKTMKEDVSKLFGTNRQPA